MTRRSKLDLRDYLEHIQQAARRISRYMGDIDHDTFLAAEEKQDAVIRNLEIIGEASENIHRHFPEFTGQYPQIPLKAAYGMRNKLSHGYFKIDLEIVWKTVATDLPVLESQVSELLDSLKT